MVRGPEAGLRLPRILLTALGRAGSAHEYFFTVPLDLGFEDCCRAAPTCHVLAYRTESLARRWYWETVELPKLVHGSART